MDKIVQDTLTNSCDFWYGTNTFGTNMIGGRPGDECYTSKLVESEGNTLVIFFNSLTCRFLDLFTTIITQLQLKLTILSVGILQMFSKPKIAQKSDFTVWATLLISLLERNHGEV
jgi:hypothetical protein